MTLQGEDIVVTINETGVFINDAQVTMADIQADNGVVHVIDAVLVPQRLTSIREQRSVNEEVRLVPNPTTDFFTIEWRGKNDTQLDIRLRNMAGQVIKQWRNAPLTQRYFINNLTPGLYIVELVDGEARAAKQLIKIR